ncbi:MAG: sigma 54 modulation/S30EA ribosomal C-terminal domain-containing protein [Candidatus Midichloria sp.]|nr:MAG: sigma 54 modulation/S30EA ribosomal C-terminal domain-containing protein [Candidatus Midichloria sp.]
MSVADAVMHMDIMDLPAYMFINSQTGATNVVYYRKEKLFPG